MYEGLFQPFHLLIVGGGCILFVIAMTALVAFLIRSLRRSPARGPEGGDVAARLARLEELRGRGLVTEDEYQAKRRHLLDEV